MFTGQRERKGERLLQREAYAQHCEVKVYEEPILSAGDVLLAVFK